ncbi:MAG: hypothetical protein ACXWVM_34770 [Polyangiales bacterium]
MGVGASASCSSSSESQPASGNPSPAATSNAQHEPVVLGRFLFSVDPLAAPDKRIVITQLGLDERSSHDGLGVAKQGTDLTSSVSLTSTSSYSTATHTLTSTVYIQNTTDDVNNWDEPTLKIASVSAPSGTTITFNQVNTGTCSGCGTAGAGATYSFADVEDSLSAFNYTRQDITVTDSNDKAFNFTVTFTASPTTSIVSADEDHDGWNPEAGAAGGDCDDTNASIHTGCTCVSTCSSCTSGGCCTDNSGTAQDCTVSGCTCTEHPTSTSTISCAAGTVCNVTTNNNRNFTISSCGTGAQCAVSCNGGSGETCAITTCDGSACNLTGTRNGSTLTIGSCKNGANCILACRRNSTCSLTCNDASSNCKMTNCNAGGTETCTLNCPGTVTDCGGGVKVCGTTC